MKYLPFSVAVAVLTLLFCAMAPGLAQAKAKAPATPPDTRKIIASIDVKNNAIVVKNMREKGATRTYKIDDFSVVTVDNQTAKFADIKVGMLVEDMVERDMDTLDSLKVMTDPNPPADNKPAPKKAAVPKKPAPKTPAAT